MSGLPFPPRAFYSLQISLFHEEVSIVSPPLNTLLAHDAGFERLVNCLSPERIVDVLNCIMLEYPIIFHSKETDALVPVIESLLSLVLPFKPQTLYLPLLPEKLIDVLQLDGPYILGLPTKNYKKVKKFIHADAYIVCLSLDKGRFYCTEKAWLDSTMSRYRPKTRPAKFPESPKKKLLPVVTSLFAELLESDGEKEAVVGEIRYAFLSYFARMFKCYKEFVSQEESGYEVNHKKLEQCSPENVKNFWAQFLSTEMFKHWMLSKSSAKDVAEFYDLHLFEEIMAQKDLSIQSKKVLWCITIELLFV